MRALAALATTAFLLAAASDARASSVVLFGPELFYADDPGVGNLVTIERDGGFYRVTDRGANVLATTDPLCTQDPADDQVVRCDAAGVTSIEVLASGGNDQVTVDSDLPASMAGGDGIDVLTGGAGNDRLAGDAGIDTLRGGAGDDVIVDIGAEGDRLEGGPGADTLSGGFGPDTVLGGPGDDPTLIGGPGNDEVDGGEGNDVLDGGDVLEGGGLDADRFIGGPGVDRLDFGFRSDPLVVSLADGANDGGPGEGDDAAADIEVLRGGQGPDVLTGGPGNDTIDGSGGADVVDGGGGNDLVDGGTDDAATDTLRGGAGDDTLEGRSGDDRLEGGDGDDHLVGETGGDSLSGDGGADRLLGGTGDDELDGGLGGDELTGGDGIDTVRYAERAALVQVTIDGVANDGEVATTDEGRSRIEEGAETAEGDNVDATNERVTATRRDDTVEGNGRPNALDGSSGEDFIDGGGGADTLSGGGANDGILARDGARDRVTCGPGYDYVVADSRDLVDARAACEYVDDGSRSAPRARKDVGVRPRCTGRRDAEVSPPGTRRGMPIDQRVLVPVGSAVDALDCPVTVIAADGRGRTRAGTLRGGSGMMQITQVRRPGGRTLTRLRTTDCASQAAIASGRVEAVASRFRKPQYRRRYGRIAFPAEVRIDSAVITKRSGVATWTVDDRCGRGATISVTSGRLVVLDLATDRRVVLGPGDSRRTTAP